MGLKKYSQILARNVYSVKNVEIGRYQVGTQKTAYIPNAFSTTCCEEFYFFEVQQKRYCKWNHVSSKRKVQYHIFTTWIESTFEAYMLNTVADLNSRYTGHSTIFSRAMHTYAPHMQPVDVLIKGLIYTLSTLIADHQHYSLT